MERKLRYLEKEIKKDDIPVLDTGENPDAPQPREMIDLEAAFEKLENELREVNQNSEALKKNFLELTELKHILRKTQTFFDEVNNVLFVLISCNSLIEMLVWISLHFLLKHIHCMACVKFCSQLRLWKKTRTFKFISLSLPCNVFLYFQFCIY